MTGNTETEADEYDKRAAEIAAGLEAAFASVPYPGDDNISESSQGHVNAEMLHFFKGRNWPDLSLEELREQRFCLYHFTPAAFRFFLPAYMRAALLHSEAVDNVWELVFGCLTPPEDSDFSAMQWFMARVEGLTANQRSAAKAYICFYTEIETSYPDPRRQRALAFWSKFAP